MDCLRSAILSGIPFRKASTSSFEIPKIGDLKADDSILRFTSLSVSSSITISRFLPQSLKYSGDFQT